MFRDGEVQLWRVGPKGVSQECQALDGNFKPNTEEGPYPSANILLTSASSCIDSTLAEVCVEALEIGFFTRVSYSPSDHNHLVAAWPITYNSKLLRHSSKRGDSLAKLPLMFALANLGPLLSFRKCQPPATIIPRRIPPRFPYCRKDPRECPEYSALTLEISTRLLSLHPGP